MTIDYSGARLPGLKSQFCIQTPTEPWEISLAFLCLIFLIHKMGRVEKKCAPSDLGGIKQEYKMHKAWSRPGDDEQRRETKYFLAIR